MGINRFWREDGVSISINSSDQSIEMRGDKLDVEDAIPTGLVFRFMRPTKVLTDNDSAISIRQLVDLSEC